MPPNVPAITLPSGGAYGYTATTDPQQDSSTHTLIGAGGGGANVNDAYIVQALGTPNNNPNDIAVATVIGYGTLAQRPLTATEGYLWYSTDIFRQDRWTSGAWQSEVMGTPSPLTTKGDVWGFSTVNARIPVGADGRLLQADSSQALGVGYSTRNIDVNGNFITNIAAGTSTTPSIYFLGDVASGLYRSAANKINIAISGVGQAFDIGASTIQSTRAGASISGSLNLGGLNSTLSSASPIWVTLTIAGTEVFDSATVTAGHWRGVSATGFIRSTNGATIADVYGLNFSPQAQNNSAVSSTVTTLVCVNSEPIFVSSGGAALNITDAVGFRFRPANSSLLGTATITNLTGILLDKSTANNATGAGITNIYGVHIFATWDPGGAGAVWGLAIESGIKSYHVGPMTIGAAAAPIASAILDLSQTTTGALVVPKMTTAQKNALTAADGMIVFDTTLVQFQVRQAAAWIRMSAA